MQKQGDNDISALENQITKEKKENEANIENYSKKKLAEANALLFKNEGYVQLEMAKSMSTNTKFYFSGEGSPLGSVLAKIMGGT